MGEQEFIRQRDIDKLHDSLENIRERFNEHTGAEEVFQGRVENYMEKIDEFGDRINKLEANQTAILSKLDEHLEETKEFSRNLKKSLWGAVTLAIGAVLGLFWEWLKSHLVKG